MTLNDILKQPKTYYKIQYFDKVVSSWKDIQKRFETFDSAHKIALLKKQDVSLRIMRICGKGRTIVAGLD